MTSYNLALAALAALVIACLVLSYFDVRTTQAVLAKPGGHENNPLMRWLQDRFPKAWPYFRCGMALMVALVWVYLLPRAGAALALGAIDSVYLMVVLSNNWWARQ